MSDSRFSADLHSHSTASDGSLTPTELVRLASEIGLRALAVTDHDTIGGLAEARAATRSLGLELIDGVELSVEDNDGRFHMLGYCFDPNSAEMADTLVDLRERRRRRNEKIIQRAHEIGLEITWDDILKHVGEDDEVVGRMASDIEYLENWSLGLDCWIILRTALMVVAPPKTAV